MFPPFKPFKSLFGDDPVQKVLEQTHLPNSSVPISRAVTQQQRQNDVLSLTLKWSAAYGEPEAFHQQLSEALHSHGIREINLHLIQEKRPAQNQTQSVAKSSLPMPPVVDAAMQSQLPAAPTDAATQQQQAQTQTPSRPTPPTQAQLPPHPRIRHVIVVASGKGGVGKSTTAVNLALALSKTGAKVGVLDADIYGPSVPAMLGVAGQSPLIENEQFIPIAAHGLAVMSIGFLTGDDNTPIVWRGPKATGALMQLFNQTAWPQLDYLVIDMPPGTGDIQLTLAQRIPVSGAVIVTTPQHIALLDAQKGIELFNKVNIPILGVIENMALHTCSQCGHMDAVFGTGGGALLEAKYHVPLLGQLPLDGNIRQHADSGQPSVVVGDAAAALYQQIASNLIAQVARLPERARDDKRIF
ncbi:MAG: iron-sulfur cluster carrier protein ApbC [Flavobacteriales bacterium]